MIQGVERFIFSTPFWDGSFSIRIKVALFDHNAKHVMSQKNKMSL